MKYEYLVRPPPGNEGVVSNKDALNDHGQYGWRYCGLDNLGNWVFVRNIIPPKKNKQQKEKQP